jgi:hypothetical protein
MCTVAAAMKRTISIALALFLLSVTGSAQTAVKGQARRMDANGPGMDSGWIQNHIVCSGVDRGVYQYLIVHKTDPRYTGNPDWAEWGGDWEYHVLVEAGSGNLVRRVPRL